MSDNASQQPWDTHEDIHRIKPMNEWVFLFGFLAFWLAMQLWILPKMGVGT